MDLHPHPLHELATFVRDEARKAAQERINEFMAEKTDAFNKDRIGGYDLAREVTGLAIPTLRNLKAQGKIPYLQDHKHGPVRFSEQSLSNWMLSWRQPTQSESIATVHRHVQLPRSMKKGGKRS